MQTIDFYTISRDYIKDFRKIKVNPKNSVIFIENVDVGKTHISLAIANKHMKSRIGVAYIGYRECIIKIRKILRMLVLMRI